MLLKGLGSYSPGQRIQPSVAAENMISLIESKSSRYSNNFAKKKEASLDEIISANKHIDIKAFFE